MCVCVPASQSVSLSVCLSAPEIQRECGGIYDGVSCHCLHPAHPYPENQRPSYLTWVIHTDLVQYLFLYDLRVTHIREN